MIFRRDNSPFAMFIGGAGTAFSSPSTRRRTCNAPAKGSICKSVARWSSPVQKIVQSTYHRRAARKIAQVVKIIRSRGFRGRCRSLGARRGFLCRRQGRFEIVAGRDGYRYLPPERDLNGMDRFVVNGCGNRERQLPLRIGVGKETRFFQKTWREIGTGKAVADEFCTRHAAACVESCEFVGESRRCQLGEPDPVGLAIQIRPSRTKAAFERLRLT